MVNPDSPRFRGARALHRQFVKPGRYAHLRSSGYRV